MFAAFTREAGCHQAPSDTSPVVLKRAAGTVQQMEMLIQLPDGFWHRATDVPCWTRTAPGPVQLFRTETTATCFAVAFRTPVPLVTNCVTIEEIALGSPGTLSRIVAIAPPEATCAGSVLTVAAGVFYARDLPPRQTDTVGAVAWQWTISADIPRGITTVTVTCTPGGSAVVPLRQPSE